MGLPVTSAVFLKAKFGKTWTSRNALDASATPSGIKRGRYVCIHISCSFFITLCKINVECNEGSSIDVKKHLTMKSEIRYSETIFFILRNLVSPKFLDTEKRGRLGGLSEISD
jgi:hypothetical protein